MRPAGHRQCCRHRQSSPPFSRPANAPPPTHPTHNHLRYTKHKASFSNKKAKKLFGDEHYHERMLRAFQGAYDSDDPTIDVDGIQHIPLDDCREVRDDDF